MAITYYDLDTKPICVNRWFELSMRGDFRLAYDVVGDCLVSTIWIGVHMEDGDPFIFETRVFDPAHECSKFYRRYMYKEEALDGHTDILEQIYKWRNYVDRHRV